MAITPGHDGHDLSEAKKKWDKSKRCYFMYTAQNNCLNSFNPDPRFVPKAAAVGIKGGKIKTQEVSISQPGGISEATIKSIFRFK